MAKISVIVPVYKVEDYLSRCVESIIGQSFSNFELILVDDGSPDGCGAMCDAYARQDDRIHVIHQANGGLSAARNTGIDWVMRHSDSQWLTFIDSDDWIHCEMLKCLLAMTEKHTVKISICGFVETAGETPQVLMENWQSAVCTPEAFYTSHSAVSVIAPGKLYHRDCFREIRYPVGKLHEDEFTTYKLLFPQKKIAVTELPLYFYFQNQTGITKSRWTPRRLDVLQAFQEQAAYFRKEGYKKACERVAMQLAWGVMEHRRSVEESDLPEEEKKHYLNWLRNCIRQAARDYGSIYLRKEPYIFTEVFPGLYGFYKRLRGRT